MTREGDTLEHEFVLKFRLTRGEVQRTPDLMELLDKRERILTESLRGQLQEFRMAVESMIEAEGWQKR